VRQDAEDKLNHIFWFDRMNKAGEWDTISGVLVYPELDSMLEPDLKELCIENSNYQFSESEIVNWINRFGAIQGGIAEEAWVLNDGFGGELSVGTGAYMVLISVKTALLSYVSIHKKSPNRLKVNYKDLCSDLEMAGSITGNRSGRDVEDVEDEPFDNAGN
jgi:hypothetical protein